MSQSPLLHSIVINGQSESLLARTLSALLNEKEIGASARGIAIAVNGAIVPRKAWPDTPLKAGDVVEIVRAHQGG